MAFERLPRVGRFFLTPGRPGNDRHGCLVLLLGRGEDGDALARGDLVALLRARLHLLPAPFRRKLHWPAWPLGGPLLVDDPQLDPERLVVALGEGGPVGDAEFRTLLNVYVATPLDPSRPLWEMALVQLPAGRAALIVKLHHAIVEGEGALSSLGALLFARDAGGTAAPQPAEPPPTLAAVTRLALTEHFQRARALLRGAAAVRPARFWRAGAETVRAYRTQLAGSRPPSVLHSPVTGNDVAVAVFEDERVQEIRRAFARFDPSFDDVVLAGLAGGLRRWLLDLGLPPQDQIVQIPVSLARRGLAPPRVFARMPSFMTIRLPVTESDPVTQLAEVCAMRTERMGQAAALQRLVQPLSHLPMPLYRRLAGRIYDKIAHFHMASLRGPSRLPHVLGRPLELAYIATPVRGRLALRLAVLALGGKATVALSCDPAIVREPDRLARCIEASIEALASAGGDARSSPDRPSPPPPG